VRETSDIKSLSVREQGKQEGVNACARPQVSERMETAQKKKRGTGRLSPVNKTAKKESRTREISMADRNLGKAKGAEYKSMWRVIMKRETAGPRGGGMQIGENSTPRVNRKAGSFQRHGRCER